MHANGQVFDLPVAAAHRLLAKTDPPAVVMNSTLFDYTVVTNDPDKVNWVFKQDIDVVKFGVNYRFWSAAPVVARY